MIVSGKGLLHLTYRRCFVYGRYVRVAIVPTENIFQRLVMIKMDRHRSTVLCTAHLKAVAPAGGLVSLNLATLRGAPPIITKSGGARRGLLPVSYTHLTLPTIYSV